jgi:hypothetical protein
VALLGGFTRGAPKRRGEWRKRGEFHGTAYTGRGARFNLHYRGAPNFTPELFHPFLRSSCVRVRKTAGHESTSRRVLKARLTK